jgi:hypothetical protein
MANQTINSEDLDGVRAIGVPRAARMYDITKNAMRKMLREAGVLIERGRIHLVLLEDLYRVMEPKTAPPKAAPTEPHPATISDADRAAFARASRGTTRH